MNQFNQFSSLHCGEKPGCVCRKCLYWWSLRCEGKCHDQGCAGGFVYQVHLDNLFTTCPKYIEIDDSRTKVHDCLEAVVVRYQDGYINCSLVHVIGCEECYRRFEEREER